jgi:citrate lyase subunit beta/citryl-CoA lyase
MPPSPSRPPAPHPRDALFAGEKPFAVIAACEHFAGSEKLIESSTTAEAK